MLSLAKPSCILCSQVSSQWQGTTVEEVSSERRVGPMRKSIQLGNSSARISPMGIGSWSWGDKWTWGFKKNDPDMDQAAAEAAAASLACGVNFFDTAEAYSTGYTEKRVGTFIQAAVERGIAAAPAVVATKYVPFPWHLNVKKNLLEHLRGSLSRLGTNSVGLYQIHASTPTTRPLEVLAGALAEAQHLGLAQSVGVSNYSEEQMRATHAALAKEGVQLATNQVEFSLLRRTPDTSGLLAACNELGVLLIAYSPLGMGRLTGKYSAANPPPGGLMRHLFASVPMTEVDPLLDTIRAIGEAHGGKTPAQVALNWVMCKGAIPIAGARNRMQAEENAGAMGWSLTKDEVEQLDSMGKVRGQNLAQRG